LYWQIMMISIQLLSKESKMNLWSTHHPIRLITILLVSMLMLSSIGFSQTSGDKISIKVKEVKLENVLRILSDKSGMIFISDPDIRTNKITLDLTDIAPLEALSIMTAKPFVFLGAPVHRIGGLVPAPSHV